MTVDELNKLKKEVVAAYRISDLSGGDTTYILGLIDAEIERQSVTDGDVQQAIEDMDYLILCDESELKEIARKLDIQFS
jgi:hypothetical protein